MSFAVTDRIEPSDPYRVLYLGHSQPYKWSMLGMTRGEQVELIEWSTAAARAEAVEGRTVTPLSTLRVDSRVPVIATQEKPAAHSRAPSAREVS